jgi:hypothetical protein
MLMLCGTNDGFDAGDFYSDAFLRGVPSQAAEAGPEAIAVRRRRAEKVGRTVTVIT